MIVLTERQAIECKATARTPRRNRAYFWTYCWAAFLALAPGAVAVAQVQDNVPSVSALKQLSMEELMNIEVTSVSRRAEKLLEAPAAIQVVTSEDIRRSGAKTIPETLRLAGNLDVAQKNSHDWAISARGFNTELANKLLVLIDGRTVYTPLFSGVFWNAQDYLLEDLEQIEVISGPGGTLWGANAVNGVISIRTRSAKDTQGLYIEGAAGTVLEDSLGVRYGATVAPNVYLRVYAKHYAQGDEVLANGADAHDSWNRTQGGFRLDAEANSASTFTLQGDAYEGDNDLPTGGASETKGRNLLARWTRTFSPDNSFTLQLYYDYTYFQEPVSALILNGVTFAPAGTLIDRLDTYDLDFQHRIAAGERHRFVWGVGYRFTSDEVSNAPALAFLPPTLDHDLYSGFIQDDIALASNLALTVGTKIEHNDYTGTEFEPNIRLQWNVTSNQALWSAISRAVRTPSRVDRDLSQAAPPYLTILRGDANFSSEIVTAYELGYRAQLGPRFAPSVTLFCHDYNDVRSTSLTPTTILPFYFANNVEGTTYGAELAAGYQLHDSWRVRASYTLLKEDLSVKSGQMDLNNARNEVADPEQQFALRLSGNFSPHVGFDANFRWVDTRPMNSGGSLVYVPSYSELDLRLSWRPTEQLEFSLVGQNLLHDQHAEYGAPGSTRSEITRSGYAKLSWHY
jgi:iron complex outermembrane receptor protein